MAYKRKTHDEWELQGNYGYGWDRLTTEETKRDAMEQLRCYRENEGIPLRIVRRRVPNEGSMA